MVKTSKENKVQYVAPKAKAFEVRAQRVICGSWDSINGTEVLDETTPEEAL